MRLRLKRSEHSQSTKQWRRNQRVWLRLRINSPSELLAEVMTVHGTPGPVMLREMYSLMAHVFWILRQQTEEKWDVQ